jgi:hypothetical protein
MIGAGIHSAIRASGEVSAVRDSQLLTLPCGVSFAVHLKLLAKDDRLKPDPLGT